MIARPVPPLAQALLRCFLKKRYGEALEGDLFEGLAGGCSTVWYWRQVGAALWEHLLFVVRRETATFCAATLFFLLALWTIAPMTYLIIDWAHASDTSRMVLLGWLTGVPFVLGAIAGTAERRRRSAAILLGAIVAYLTPLTAPFESAVCDLCAVPSGTALFAAVPLLASFCSALIVGIGLRVAWRFHPTTIATMTLP